LIQINPEGEIWRLGAESVETATHSFERVVPAPALRQKRPELLQRTRIGSPLQTLLI
jgi:hypothetical protein